MTHTVKKVVLIATGVITFVIIASIIALLVNIQAFKPQIEAAASEAFGMEVRIKGRLGIALFPGIGIALKNVSVRNKEAEVVTVERIKIGLRFISLAKREVRINRVRLVKPVFSLVRQKNGAFNFQNAGRAPSERPFFVEKMSISQGKLVYTDVKSGERTEMDGFNVAIQNLSYSGAADAKPFKSISFEGDISCKRLLINNIRHNG